MLDPLTIPLQLTRHGRSTSFPLISQISDDLYLGGARAAGLLTLPSGIDHVIRLVDAHWYDLGSTGAVEHVAAIEDSTGQDLGDAWHLAELAAEIPAGEPVLFHCQFGLNRSGAIAARTLMIRDGLSSEEAIALLRDKRTEHVLFNEHFVRQLRAFD